VASWDLCIQKLKSILHNRPITVELLIKKALIMLAEVQTGHRFVRRTQLGPNEYRKNFHQIDREVMNVITSAEADQVTPLMSKIYLRMVGAPTEYWEREGVLRVEADVREDRVVKAWAVFCELVGVASATANKAVRWMHDQGIIGYFAGKNGVGLRIFLNRAASSVGVRTLQGSKKILEFSPASSQKAPASQNEPAFNDTYGVREVSDTDFNSHAPKSGAADKTMVVKTSPETQTEQISDEGASATTRGREVAHPEIRQAPVLNVSEIVRQLKFELEPSLQQAARLAARAEHERTREWLESRGLPKAARVAQREAYNVLKNHGVINAANERARVELEVGRSHDLVEAKPLSSHEVKELAEMCIALLETHGQSIDTTLSEISSEAGGCLLPEDAPRVRDLAESMVQKSNS
jgi:hypothetical protein